MSSPSGAWYKSPWVWFILFLLASAVIASLYTVHIAYSLPNDMLQQNVSKFALEEETEDDFEDSDVTSQNIELPESDKAETLKEAEERKEADETKGKPAL